MSMRKIKEVLRLRFELRLGQREIARACSISQGAVHNYLKRAAAAGIAWPTPEGWDEQRVEQALFGERQVVKRLPEQVLPDFAALHAELQQHPHLTLQLTWEEYRQVRSEEHTSELQSHSDLVCRLLLEKKKKNKEQTDAITR